MPGIILIHTAHIHKNHSRTVVYNMAYHTRDNTPCAIVDKSKQQTDKKGKRNLLRITVHQTENHCRHDNSNPRSHSPTKHASQGCRTENELFRNRSYDSYGQCTNNSTAYIKKLLLKIIFKIQTLRNQIAGKHSEQQCKNAYPHIFIPHSAQNKVRQP